jgi:hypothetical protein
MDAGTGSRSGIGLRVLALVLLGVPVGLLSMVVLREFTSGDSRALNHGLETIPLILVTASAFRWPRTAGAILVVFGLAALVVYPLQAFWRLSWQTILLVEVVIVTPTVLAGLVLRRATRETH